MFVISDHLGRALRLLFPFLIVGLVSACSSSSSGGNNTGPQLTGLTVSPGSVVVTAGGSFAVSATASFSDGSSQDVTDLAGWASSDEVIATVGDGPNDSGVITGLAEGNTSVVASFRGLFATVSVEVLPATLSRIEVSPASATIAAGTQQQFQATAIFSDNSTQTVTGQASWSSDDTDVATVSDAEGSKGLASAQMMGSASITAIYQGEQASAALTVSSATVTDLAIEPVNSSVAMNRTRQFTATATFSDATTQDVTDSTTWSSADEDVATISNTAPDQGLAMPVAQGTTEISGSFEGQTDTTDLTVTAAVAVDEVTVTPAEATIAKGTTQQFTATAVYADGQSEDVTTEATWASSDETVATVSNEEGTEGRARGVESSPDPVEISAEFLDTTGTAMLTVGDAELVSISVTPPQPSAPAGSTVQFTATGTFTDDSTQDITDTVVWSSSNTSVASVSNGTGSEGLATADAQGTATITAASDDIEGSTTLTVTAATLESISVEPTNETLANGYRLDYTATGVFSDGSNRDVTTTVTWSVTNSALATISNASGTKGQLRAASSGTGNLVVRATQNNVTGQTGLEVTAATLDSITVTPADETLAEGEQQQYTADGNFSDGTTQDLTNQVTWASSDTSVASISSSGRVTAEAASDQDMNGNPVPIMITATDEVDDGVMGDTTLIVTDAQCESVTVTPASAEIPDGTMQQYQATCTFTDNSTMDVTASDNLNWTSSNTDAATICNSNDPMVCASKGQATAADPGNTTITATHTVRNAADSVPLTVTDAQLVSIAIDGEDPDDSIADGQTNQYSAEGTYTDDSTATLTTEVTWQSSSTIVATISNATDSEGLATAQSPGSTNITATLDGVTSDPLGLEVTDAALVSLEVTPATESIAAGTSLQYTATGTFTDGSTDDVTNDVAWSTNKTDIVSIGNDGLAFGREEDPDPPATITATSSETDENGDPIFDTAELTVTAATLQNISITPSGTSEVPAGFQLQLTATGHYSDNSQQDITNDVAWSSLDSDIATVTATGLVEGRAAGSTSILASLDGVQASKGITVTEATLTSITISNDDPDNTFSGIGDTMQFMAEGAFDSGLSGFELTTQVTWNSSNPTACTISNMDGSEGEATAVASGSSNITATRDGVTSNTVTVTVP